MADLTPQDVLKLARLSRLRLSKEEIERFTSELSAILKYVEQLSAVDTKNLEPTSQVTGLTNVLRADEIIDYGESSEALLKNAPDRDGNYIKVKRVLE
jgi:aspartyl-tRNA(Asn)/glutamyl-tRNA(Gln) amidotransferase subunit C